jgi:hypothetical protein
MIFSPDDARLCTRESDCQYLQCADSNSHIGLELLSSFAGLTAIRAAKRANVCSAVSLTYLINAA